MRQYILSILTLLSVSVAGANEEEAPVLEKSELENPVLNRASEESRSEEKEYITRHESSQNTDSNKMKLARGYPDNHCFLRPGFNMPANIKLDCGANVFINGKFIYWEAIQGGMDLALPGQATTSNPLAGVQHSALGYPVLIQDVKYSPGFKAGLGWSGATDDWAYYGEYTWFRSTTRTSADPIAPGVSAINGVTVGGIGIWVPTSWLPYVYTSNNETNHISSKWDCNLDIADLQVSRAFYSGRRVILEPFLGLRGLWVRQKLNINANVLDDGVVTVSGTSRTAKYTSRAWSVGPRLGMNGKWHFGGGLKMIGDTGLSLLYTRYTKVSQNVPTPDAADIPAVVTLQDFNILRPNMDFSIGLGWGSYCMGQRMHFDFEAAYDFKMFLEQNMMRYLSDLTTNTQAHPDGAVSNLYLHGLTVKIGFEF